MEPIIIDELARMLEDRGREQGQKEGEARGLREGEARARLESARSVIGDLSEMLAIVLDEEKRAFIAAASLPELEALRLSLKRDRAWPTGR